MRMNSEQKLARGTIVLVTGPSGSGKSTAIETISNRFGTKLEKAHQNGRRDLPLIDAWPTDPQHNMRRLQQAGLADPFTWARTYHELSDGQKARFQLADLGGLTRKTIVIDEWLAKLDRLTARAVAHATGRQLRRNDCQAILLTSQEDLLAELNPDVHIRVGWKPEPQESKHPYTGDRSGILDELFYERGTWADYSELKHLHYAAGDPCTKQSIHVLRHPEIDHPAAVAVLAYPPLHCQGRNIAARDRYKIQGNPHAARLLNMEVRQLSRVIVAPELRCLGIAGKLIQHITEEEPMQWIECSTQMGRFSTFLQTAGFSRIDQAPATAEAVLQDMAVQLQVPGRAHICPVELHNWTETLPIRKRRKFRRAVWLIYHHNKLHRKTRGRVPKNVPGLNDPRWADAFAMATVRLSERPAYWIRQVGDPAPQKVKPPPQPHNPGTVEESRSRFDQNLHQKLQTALQIPFPAPSGRMDGTRTAKRKHEENKTTTR